MKLYIKKEDDQHPTNVSNSELAQYVIETLKADDIDVPGYDDNNGPAEVCETFAGMALNGDPEPDFSEFPVSDEQKKAFAKTFELINDLLGGGKNKKNKEAYEKAEAEIKEAEKEKKENEKKEIEEKRMSFADAAKTGIKKAQDDFKEELSTMSEGLPDGVTITTGDHGGVQMVLSDDADDSAIAASLAYFAGKSDNSAFIAGTLQFLAGDAAELSVARGVYKDVKQAAKYISEHLEAELNYKLGARQIETYARMARRTPVEDRNPRIDPTAYLAVATAPSPKLKSFDNKKDWEAAKEAHEEERSKLIKRLGNGEATVEIDGKEQTLELKSRKDVLPLVENMQVKCGVSKPKDPNEKSAGDWLNQYFWASNALQNLAGIVEADKVVFRCKADHEGCEKHTLGDGSVINTITLTVAQLTDSLEEAKNNLENIKYSQQNVTLAEFMAGETTKEVVVKEETEDGKIVTKRNPMTKEPVKEEIVIPCYPDYPFKS